MRGNWPTKRPWSKPLQTAGEGQRTRARADLQLKTTFLEMDWGPPLLCDRIGEISLHIYIYLLAVEHELLPIISHVTKAVRTNDAQNFLSSHFLHPICIALFRFFHAEKQYIWWCALNAWKAEFISSLNVCALCAAMMLLFIRWLTGHAERDELSIRSNDAQWSPHHSDFTSIISNWLEP